MEKNVLLKQICIMTCFLALYNMVFSQDEHYLATRIKPGDICYLDGGEERFMGYRDWNQSNPPGTPIGVVFFTYYGTFPPDTEGEKGWHGWMIELGESDTCAWAPETSVCYNNCVATYAVEGINTPFNPNNYQKTRALADTCGWQNTFRILEFLYEGQGTIVSDATIPSLRYIFAEKNGVTDFSVKPVMNSHSWYLPSLGQLRLAYGEIGPVNSALAACGGTLLTSGNAWHSSTELSSPTNSAWGMNDRGYCPAGNLAKKHRYKKVRAVRCF